LDRVAQNQAETNSQKHNAGYDFAQTARVSQKTLWFFGASESALDAYNHSVYKEICLDYKEKLGRCLAYYACYACIVDHINIMSFG